MIACNGGGVKVCATRVLRRRGCSHVSVLFLLFKICAAVSVGTSVSLGFRRFGVVGLFARLGLLVWTGCYGLCNLLGFGPFQYIYLYGKKRFTKIAAEHEFARPL